LISSRAVALYRKDFSKEPPAAILSILLPEHRL
jgi:hypothetical protein